MVEILDTKPKKEKEEELEVELISFSKLKDYANGKTGKPLESFRITLVGENEVRVSEKKDFNDGEAAIALPPKENGSDHPTSPETNSPAAPSAPGSFGMPKFHLPHFSFPHAKSGVTGKKTESPKKSSDQEAEVDLSAPPKVVHKDIHLITVKKEDESPDSKKQKPIDSEKLSSRTKLIIGVIVFVSILVAIAAFFFLKSFASSFSHDDKGILSYFAADPTPTPAPAPTETPIPSVRPAPIDYSTIDIQKMVADKLMEEKTIELGRDKDFFTRSDLFEKINEVVPSLELNKIYLLRIFGHEEEMNLDKLMGVLGIKLMPIWEKELKPSLTTYRIMLYRESDSEPRLGLLCIFNKDKVLTISMLRDWEGTIANDLRGLYWDDHQGKIDNGKVFTASSISERRRFLNFLEDQSLSLDYAVAKDGMLVVTSKNFGTKLLDILLGHEQ